MKNRFVPLFFIPLIALYLGWSIQPVAYQPVSKINTNPEWPEFAVREFRKAEDPSLVLSTTAGRHDMFAVNH